MKTDDNIVGYDEEGNPVTYEEFMTDLNLTLQQLEDGTLETYTSKQVREKIFGE